MMSTGLDDHQVCRGLIAMNLQTLELKSFYADAVIMATGGPGLIFGKSTNSMTCTGSAASACYQQGAKYANGEFIQVHPTSIPGEDKLRLMSESARGEGGRVWVPKNQGDKRAAKIFRPMSAGISWKKNIRLTAILCRAILRRERFSKFVSTVTAWTAKIRFISI
jgi:succinate dehydrogenase/fumarate reductase flavoprotein subunit